MVTTEFEMAAGLLKAFKEEVLAKELPLHVQEGLPFVDENGNPMIPVQIDLPDDFDLNEVLSDVITKLIKK